MIPRKGTNNIHLIWLIGLHVIVYAGVATIVAAPLEGIAVAVCAVLLWVSINDWLTHEIPDTASLLLAALAAAWVWVSGGSHLTVVDHLAAALFWPLAFWITGRIYLMRRGIHGLGFGDVKLMIGIGLLCGFTGTVVVVLSASVAAAVTLLVWGTLLQGQKNGDIVGVWSTALAFGPFLCLSAWVTWLAMQT